MQGTIRVVLAATAAAVVLIACGAAWAGPKVLRPDDPEAEDVQAAAKAFYEKLADGDAAGAKALFDGPRDQADLLDAYVRFVTAAGKLHDATGGKFGKGRDGRLKQFGSAMVRARAEQLSEEPVSLNGDLASIATLSPLNCGSDLHRVDGKWKLTHLATQRGQTRAMIKFLDAAAAAADEIRGQIDSGKITGPEGVESALNDRVDPAFTELLASPREAGKSTEKGPAGPTGPPTTGPSFGAEELRQLIGKKFASPEVQRLIDRLPGAPHLAAFPNGPTGTLYVSSPEIGLSFLVVLPGGEVRSVFLFAEGEEGNRKFPGELPEGLSMSDTRRDVERKLGPPPSSGGGWKSHYQASYPGKGIHVAYASESVSDPNIPIANITLNAPRPEADEPATRPGKAAKGSPRLTVRLVATDAKPDDPAVDFLPTFDSSEKGEKLAVSREVLLDQGDVAEISPRAETGGGTSISLTMTEAGAKRLEQVTKANIGKRLAVVFDDLVLVAPTIRAPVSKSVVVTFGASTPEDERYRILGRLHAALTALPAPPGAATEPARPRPSTREAQTPTERQ